MSAPAYPKRPQFFAHRFTRLLGKVCIGAEIGPDACWLLAYVAHTEDAAGYRRSITFFNEDLSTRLGMSLSSMRRARERAVKAGWLVYVEGGKRKPPQYHVAIPGWASAIKDGAGDEAHDDFPVQLEQITDRQPAGKRQESEQTTDREAADNRQETGHPSSLPQNNLPQEPPPPCGGVEAGRGAMVTVVEDEQKPSRPRNLLFDAVAEITGSDAAVNGGRVGNLAALLGKAKPPYTPDEVYEFGRRYGEFCTWGPEKGRHRPTLNEVREHIGKVRAKPPPRQTTITPPPPARQTPGQSLDDQYADFASKVFVGNKREQSGPKS